MKAGRIELLSLPEFGSAKERLERVSKLQIDFDIFIRLKSYCRVIFDLWVNPKGYSKIRVNGKKRFVHRVAYALANPEWDLDSSDQINHACDNPGCVNPLHLHLGDNVSNMREKVARGRQWRGGAAKPWSRVRALRILMLYELGVRRPEIIQIIGCSTSLVYDVCSGSKWPELRKRK